MLEKHQSKLKELDYRMQLKENRDKFKERKTRTHRLIEMGTLAEKYLNIHTTEDFETWLKKYVSEQQNKSRINDIMQKE